MATTETERPLRAADDEPLGRTIEDAADDPDRDEEDEKPTPPMQLAIPGTRDRISSSFGGAKPTSSEVRLLGGTQVLSGEYDKGETIRLLVEAKVTSVEGLDVTDDWGETTRTIRRHKARFLSVRPLTEEDEVALGVHESQE